MEEEEEDSRGGVGEGQMGSADEDGEEDLLVLDPSHVRSVALPTHVTGVMRSSDVASNAKSASSPQRPADKTKGKAGDRLEKTGEQTAVSKSCWRMHASSLPPARDSEECAGGEGETGSAAVWSPAAAGSAAGPLGEGARRRQLQSRSPGAERRDSEPSEGPIPTDAGHSKN